MPQLANTIIVPKFQQKCKRPVGQLTVKPLRTRYCSGFNTIDALPAKLKLTGGNMSLTLETKWKAESEFKEKRNHKISSPLLPPNTFLQIEFREV